MNLQSAIDGYFIAKTADGYSPETLKMYRWALDLIARFIGNRELAEITGEHLQAFWAWVRTGYQPTRMNGSTEPLSGRSLENIWTAMRSFFGWAEGEGLLLAGAVRRPDMIIQRPRYGRSEIVPYTKAEVDRMLKACERSVMAQTDRRTPFTMPRPTAARDAALILLLLDTGLRASECARLSVGDANMLTGELTVRSHGTGRKTKARHVPIGRQVRKAVWRYLAGREHLRETDALFLTDDGKPMDRTSIRQAIVRIGKAARVGHPHPHRFRHTFSIEFLRNGGDIFTLQRLLGHESLEMVQRYLRLSKADTNRAHQRASPADNWVARVVGDEEN